MKLNDRDKAVVALLYDEYGAEFAVRVENGLHGPVYRLGSERLYMVGIIAGKTLDCAEYQVLIFSMDPLTGEEIPDIPPGCEPRKCTFAVLQRTLVGEDAQAAEYPFLFEALELKERVEYTLIFALTGIRV